LITVVSSPLIYALKKLLRETVVLGRRQMFGYVPHQHDALLDRVDSAASAAAQNLVAQCLIVWLHRKES
jgi:hypothetical protein